MNYPAPRPSGGFRRAPRSRLETPQQNFKLLKASQPSLRASFRTSEVTIGLHGVRDDGERQADSPDIRKDTFVIQSDHRVSDYIPFNLGVGHEAERVRDVGQVFLWRGNKGETNGGEGRLAFHQPYLQRLSSAGLVFFLGYLRGVIGHVVDAGLLSAAGGVGQVQTIQRHVVIRKEILLRPDS